MLTIRHKDKIRWIMFILVFFCSFNSSGTQEITFYSTAYGVGVTEDINAFVESEAYTAVTKIKDSCYILSVKEEISLLKKTDTTIRNKIVFVSIIDNYFSKDTLALFTNDKFIYYNGSFYQISFSLIQKILKFLPIVDANNFLERTI